MIDCNAQLAVGIGRRMIGDLTYLALVFVFEGLHIHDEEEILRKILC